MNQYFPGSYGVDDFVHRLETALYSFGFNGDNTVGAHPRIRRHMSPCLASGERRRGTDGSVCPAACVDICRDEITATLKSKVRTHALGPYNPHVPTSTTHDTSHTLPYYPL